MTLDRGVPGIFIPLFLRVRELILKVCGNPVSRRPRFPSEYAVYSSLVLFHGVVSHTTLAAHQKAIPVFTQMLLTTLTGFGRK